MIEAMKDALITLVFARGSIEDWGGYASEYFQNKHDLKGDIFKVDKAITALRQAIEQAEKQDQWGASSVTKPEYVAAQKEKTQRALDLMAENARELGLDYEPVQAEKQEPVAWVCAHYEEGVKNDVDYWQDEIDALPIGTLLYTAPPQRERKCDNCGEFGSCCQQQQATLSAAPVQEPVAWMHTKIEGVVVPHRPADLDRHPDRWEALYKTSPPCPTCEALARTVMMDQTGRDA